MVSILVKSMVSFQCVAQDIPAKLDHYYSCWWPSNTKSLTAVILTEQEWRMLFCKNMLKLGHIIVDGKIGNANMNLFFYTSVNYQVCGMTDTIATCSLKNHRKKLTNNCWSAWFARKSQEMSHKLHVDVAFVKIATKSNSGELIKSFTFSTWRIAKIHPSLLIQFLLNAIWPQGCCRLGG